MYIHAHYNMITKVQRDEVVLLSSIISFYMLPLAGLFHDLLLYPVSQHSVWSEITSRSTRSCPLLGHVGVTFRLNAQSVNRDDPTPEPSYVTLARRGRALSVNVHYRCTVTVTVTDNAHTTAKVT